MDLGNYTHEWVIDDLPWDSATSIPVGGAHPDTLDQKLVDAIVKDALPKTLGERDPARGASIAFLYLYMSMAHGTERLS